MSERDAGPGGAGDTTIVRAAIYPAIGIARLGNSESEYFLAPEVTEPLPEPPGFYRDPTGALNRQSVRFRVYGLNAAGRAVAELTANNAEIRWTVHLANKKSAWYQFQIALDIPEAGSAPPSWLRNITISDRNRLIIDPGPRHISGRDTGGDPAYRFDTGAILGTPVYLGEIRTDPQGRLIVFGGRGKSASYNGARAVTFANNEGWHDDTSGRPGDGRGHIRGPKAAGRPGLDCRCPAELRATAEICAHDVGSDSRRRDHRRDIAEAGPTII